MVSRELVHPCVRAVLKRMNADLRPSNLGAAKLTGATLLREFLEHRVAPLRAHLLPLWRLGEADAALRLSFEALADEDLATVLHALVGGRCGEAGGYSCTPVPLGQLRVGGELHACFQRGRACARGGS